MATCNISSDTLDLLAYLSDCDKAEKEEIMNKALRSFVEKHHKNKISVLKDGRYSTQIGKGKNNRRFVRKKTEKELYQELYDYYKEKEEYTISAVFELSQQIAHDSKGNSEQTILRKQQFFDQWATNEFADMTVNAVTNDFLGQYIQQQIKAINPTQKALEGFRGVLNQIFLYALNHGLITANPMNEIDVTSYFKLCRTDHKEAKYKIYTAEEFQLIKDYIAENPRSEYDPQQLAVLFTMNTGDRVGELPILKWTDIDFEKELIHIHGQQQQYWLNGKKEVRELNYTKNERCHPLDGRYFPMTDKLKALLYEIKARQKEAGIKSEYLFCKADGTPITKQSIGKYYAYRCKLLGLKITNLHAVRMTLNSLEFCKLGISPAEQAYILGHSIRTNQEHYTYTREEQVNDIRQKINAYRTQQEHESVGNVVSFKNRKRTLDTAKYQES